MLVPLRVPALTTLGLAPTQETALEMIHTIREAFNELLAENDWMDNETRAVAKEKADQMNERIGYPELLTNPKELSSEYIMVSLIISPRNLFPFGSSLISSHFDFYCLANTRTRHLIRRATQFFALRFHSTYKKVILSSLCFHARAPSPSSASTWRLILKHCNRNGIVENNLKRI